MRREDSQLVRLCLEGQIEAFAELIDRYEKPLFNTALRMTGDYEDARDITQTTFVKAYQALGSFRPDFKFFSWIYRIMLNESLNTIKHRHHEEELDPNRVADGNTPDQDYDATELSEQINQALCRLSFDHRIVVVLRHFNDLSYDEMAQILSIPLKTVKSRLYAARQQLASILEGMGVAYR